MNPGERYETIQRTAQLAVARANDEWADLDLLFGMFQIPTSDFWNGNSKLAYAKDMLAQTSDDNLLTLSAYLDPEPVADAGGEHIWQPNMFRAFVSHISAERARVGELRSSLQAVGIDAFVAHDSINPSEQWLAVIRQALASCDALVAVLHDGFRASDWCDQEVGWAVGRSLPIVPLHFDAMPYGFMGHHQAIDARGKSASELAQSIFDCLLTNKVSADKLRPAAEAATRDLVDAFLAATTYYNIRDAFDELQQAHVWSHELLDDVARAPAINRAIHQCNMVPNENVQRFVDGRRRRLPARPAPQPVATAEDDDIPF